MKNKKKKEKTKKEVSNTYTCSELRTHERPKLQYYSGWFLGGVAKKEEEEEKRVMFGLCMVKRGRVIWPKL